MPVCCQLAPADDLNSTHAALTLATPPSMPPPPCCVNPQAIRQTAEGHLQQLVDLLKATRPEEAAAVLAVSPFATKQSPQLSWDDARTANPKAASVGAAVLAFLRSRVSAPRDMSAAAAEQLRAACDTLLLNLHNA